MRRTHSISRTVLRFSAWAAGLITVTIGGLVIADSLHRRDCQGSSASHKGESYEFIGERLTLLNTGKETNGEMLEIDVLFKPTAETNLLKWRDVHVHPHQEERFEVISGVVRFRIGNREHILTAGQSITGPLEDDRTLMIRLDMARLRARFNVATDEEIEAILMEYGVVRDSDPEDCVCAGRSLMAFEPGEVISQRQV